MPATPGDFAYFLRGELVRVGASKVSDLGFEYFIRGEQMRGLVNVAAAAAAANPPHRSPYPQLLPQ